VIRVEYNKENRCQGASSCRSTDLPNFKNLLFRDGSLLILGIVNALDDLNNARARRYLIYISNGILVQVSRAKQKKPEHISTPVIACTA
jgi:hypothetical protein